MNNDHLQQRVTRVLSEFGLARPQRVTTLGGTASETALAEGDFGRIVVRWRAPEFSCEEWVRFDHRCLQRLATAGVPVPVPCVATEGNTWIHDNHQTVELLTWRSGHPFRQGDQMASMNLGRTLATFHTVLANDVPHGKQNFVREDHPDRLQEYVEALRPLCRSYWEREQLSGIATQLDFVRDKLDATLYGEMPHAVTHGDIHPGNIQFDNSCVSAIYDFDYMSAQARTRDLCDALMFFAASRQEPLDTNDIWSLTQPFRLQPESCQQLLTGYQEISPLTDLDWQGLPLLMRSQWCQIRLRGSRKVRKIAKVRFVLQGFAKMIAWLDHSADAYFARLRENCQT